MALQKDSIFLLSKCVICEVLGLPGQGSLHFFVSRMMYLKCKDMGILNDFKYSTISDTDLEANVQTIQNLMPDIGESTPGGIQRSMV